MGGKAQVCLRTFCSDFFLLEYELHLVPERGHRHCVSWSSSVWPHWIVLDGARGSLPTNHPDVHLLVEVFHLPVEEHQQLHRQECHGLVDNVGQPHRS